MSHRPKLLNQNVLTLIGNRIYGLRHYPLRAYRHPCILSIDIQLSDLTGELLKAKHFKGFYRAFLDFLPFQKRRRLSGLINIIFEQSYIYFEPGPSVWVEGERVDGTEMSLDAPEFFFHQKVEESRFEFSVLSRGRRDVTRVLTSSNHYMLRSRAKFRN